MVEIKPQGVKGKVIIAKDVLANIAGAAALDVEGVVAPSDTQFDFKLPRKNPRSQYRWVKIEYKEKLEITLNIHVKTGFKVVGVSEEIQKKVKNEVETMTGVDVFTVNVVALGVAA
ncbi:MAG: Asp23/Gls24 family envelope stress response protein [Defluviitaleaceae bacterium]|nr:Asp23/Gls24 family envelope stress response protein [Defluviitaleaceae bacterium]